ncbi:MAG TPA: hypothetical protein HPQ00_13505, partial [Magnetococcales bacterium]|nr:hypothetical protein [Magnetococcales bacterium]
MINVRFIIALVQSMILHVWMLGLLFLGLRMETKLPKQDIMIAPVQLIQLKEEKMPLKPPEKPDLLAQVNRITENKPNKPELENPLKVSPVPEPPSNSKPPPSVPEPLSIPLPENSRQQKIDSKIEIKKHVADVSEKQKKALQKNIVKNPDQEPLISQPLNLSPTLSEIDHWDQEKNIKDNMQGEKEQTLDLNTSKVRYAVYFSRMKERIEQGWIYPEKAKHLNLSGNVRIKFTIARDGGLLGINILRSFGES